MDIEKFVDGVTITVNSKVNQVISQKNFAYQKLLEESSKIFKRRWDAALEICGFRSLSSDLDEKMAYDVAIASCLITQAMFVLDDVIDKTEEREGRSAIWAKYGVNETLIATHTLVDMYMEQLVHVGLDRDVLSSAIDRLDILLRGEHRDIIRNKRNVLTEEEYWKLCSEKAGAITETHTELAAKAAHAGPEREKIISRCGELIGILAQVIDDLLDLEEDISEGKTSLPIILLEERGGDVTDRLWEDLKELGVLESVKQKISSLAQEGIDLTFKLEDNEYTGMLRDVFVLWDKFYSAILEREDAGTALKAIGADGIERSFELMFIRTKPEMGRDEINKIIDEVMNLFTYVKRAPKLK